MSDPSTPPKNTESLTENLPQDGSVSAGVPLGSQPPGVVKIERLRNHLERNRIFFETVAATLLSVMAIVISVAQIVIAVKQNKLTALQAEISRQQAIPQFVVRLEQVYSQESATFAEDKIVVTNQGGLVQDLNCIYAIFLDAEYLPSPGEYKKAEIPINGYYDAIFLTGQGTGQVLSLEGIKNNDRYINLERKVREMVDGQKGIANLELRRYLRLTYRDIFGEHHTRYYYVRPIYGGSVMDEKEGFAVFDKFEESFKNSSKVEFDGLNPDSLLSLIKANAKDSQ